MGKLVQRKRFDHVELARQAAAGFRLLDPSAPGVDVTSEGPLVLSGGLLLPDYELVS